MIEGVYVNMIIIPLIGKNRTFYYTPGSCLLVEIASLDRVRNGYDS